MARIFIGIPVSNIIASKIQSIQDNLASLPLRFIKKQNLHLTLIPPWEEPHPEIITELLKSIRAKQFQIYFNEISLGTNRLNPKMLWLKSQGSKEALYLKNRLTEALGFTKEERKFNPHITLAKFHAENFPEISLKFQDQKIKWQEFATQFNLYKSHISGSGSDYEILHVFNLS